MTRGTSDDAFLGGRLILRQPLKGYRAGLDAALLAASITLRPKQHGLEIGCGAGAALLQAALRTGAQLTGLERDQASLELAIGNVALNKMQDCVKLYHWDIKQPFRDLDLEPFDLVFANPPYFEDLSRLRLPDSSRHTAFLMNVSLKTWLDFMLKSVKDKGTIVIIHRAERLLDIISGLSDKAGSFRIRPIQAFPNSPAKRVLIKAVKAGKAPLTILPPLILRDRGEKAHRADVEAILRGENILES